MPRSFEFVQFSRDDVKSSWEKTKPRLFAIQNETICIVVAILLYEFLSVDILRQFFIVTWKRCALLCLEVNKISPSVFRAFISFAPSAYTYRRIGVSIFSVGKYGTVTRVRISQQTIFPVARIESIFLKIVSSFPVLSLSLSLSLSLPLDCSIHSSNNRIRIKRFCQKIFHNFSPSLSLSLSLPSLFFPFFLSPTRITCVQRERAFLNARRLKALFSPNRSKLWKKSSLFVSRMGGGGGNRATSL